MNYYFFLDDINNYSLKKNDVIIEDNITIKIFNNMKFSFNIYKSFINNVKKINWENDYFLYIIRFIINFLDFNK